MSETNLRKPVTKLSSREAELILLYLNKELENNPEKAKEIQGIINALVELEHPGYSPENKEYTEQEAAKMEEAGKILASSFKSFKEIFFKDIKDQDERDELIHRGYEILEDLSNTPIETLSSEELESFPEEMANCARIAKIKSITPRENLMAKKLTEASELFSSLSKTFKDLSSILCYEYTEKEEASEEKKDYIKVMEGGDENLDSSDAKDLNSYASDLVEKNVDEEKSFLESVFPIGAVADAVKTVVDTACDTVESVVETATGVVEKAADTISNVVEKTAEEKLDA